MFPTLSLRFVPIWQRNFLVWKKLAIPSMLGNLADPVFYMVGLGFGLGALLPAVNGVPYIQFLVSGTVCFSTMNAATFEALYSAFSRMHVQKTWPALLNAPLIVDDIVLAEWLWAASKSLLSGLSILVVMTALGLAKSPLILWLIPLIILTGLVFAGLGLVVNAISPSYDFFMYYFTLVITPMSMVSGVFYPIEQLPQWLQSISSFLPLTHAIQLARPLVNGYTPPHIAISLLILILYAALSFCCAVWLTRRRLAR